MLKIFNFPKVHLKFSLKLSFASKILLHFKHEQITFEKISPNCDQRRKIEPFMLASEFKEDEDEWAWTLIVAFSFNSTKYRRRLDCKSLSTNNTFVSIGRLTLKTGIAIYGPKLTKYLTERSSSYFLSCKSALQNCKFQRKEHLDSLR